MSASRSSGFGGGGVGQKFKPLLSKLVSDWVSSIEDKLTILVFIYIYIYIYKIWMMFSTEGMTWHFITN